MKNEAISSFGTVGTNQAAEQYADFSSVSANVYRRNKVMSMEDLCAGWTGEKIGAEWGGPDVGAESVENGTVSSIRIGAANGVTLYSDDSWDSAETNKQIAEMFL